MRDRFQKKDLPGVAVRPGRVRFAPRPRRHGICRQAEDTTAIGGRDGVTLSLQYLVKWYNAQKYTIW